MNFKNFIIFSFVLQVYQIFAYGKFFGFAFMINGITTGIAGTLLIIKRKEMDRLMREL